MGIFSIGLVNNPDTGKAELRHVYSINKGDIIKLDDDYKEGRKYLYNNTYYVVEKITNKELVLYKLDSMVSEEKIRKIHIKEYEPVFNLIRYYIPVDTGIAVEEDFDLYLNSDSILSTTILDGDIVDSLLSYGYDDISVGMKKGSKISIVYKKNSYSIKCPMRFGDSVDNVTILLDNKVSNIDDDNDENNPNIIELVNKIKPIRIKPKDMVIYPGDDG